MDDTWPVMDVVALERGFKELAWWSLGDRPTRPQLIPGMPAENFRRLREYWSAEVAWRAGRAERLLHGLDETYKPRHWEGIR